MKSNQMANKSKHTHKYHRVGKFNSLWACALPDCNHYMPKHLEELLPGKASVCWECGDAFILTTNNMKADKPLCDECNPVMVGVTDFLKEKGI